MRFIVIYKYNINMYQLNTISLVSISLYMLSCTISDIYIYFHYINKSSFSNLISTIYTLVISNYSVTLKFISIRNSYIAFSMDILSSLSMYEVSCKIEIKWNNRKMITLYIFWFGVMTPIELES